MVDFRGKKATPNRNPFSEKPGFSKKPGFWAPSKIANRICLVPVRGPIMATVGGRVKRGVPEGLWIRCPQCKATIFRKEMESRWNVCPECNYHFHLAAGDRIAQLLDE